MRLTSNPFKNLFSFCYFFYLRQSLKVGCIHLRNVLNMQQRIPITDDYRDGLPSLTPYIYIYIYRERERERGGEHVIMILEVFTSFARR